MGMSWWINNRLSVGTDLPGDPTLSIAAGFPPNLGVVHLCRGEVESLHQILGDWLTESGVHTTTMRM